MSSTVLAKLYSFTDHWAVPQDSTSLTIFFLTTILVAVALYTFSDGKKKRPPGPWGLPIVGYLPFMGNTAHITFHKKLAPKYGPVMSVKLGSLNSVVLGSSEAVKEAFVKQNEIFSGRPYNLNFRVYDHENAFVYQEGETWKDMRTFSVQTLRDLGFGQQSLEPVVQTEIQYFCKYLEEESKKHKEGFQISTMLEKSIGINVCAFLLGYRCEYDDPWLVRVIEVIDGLFQTYMNDYTLYFPWLLKIPVLSKYFENPNKRPLKDELWSLWQQKIDIAKKAGALNGVNFVNAWLNEYKKRLENDDPSAERFNESSLLSNLDVLCQASFETSSTTIQWAFFFMLLHPDLQVKLQEEIDEVIGQERVPAYSDAKNMPFTRAFIAETHRKGSIAPLGVFHENREGTYLMGYWIPKRTFIISNQYAVHHDPTIFPEPERFNPSRYLDSNGKFVKHDSVIPFSAGKRFCPGEFVAEMQVFLYLTMILQKYKVVSPAGYSLCEEPTNTQIIHPKPFNMLLQKRN